MHFIYRDENNEPITEVNVDEKTGEVRFRNYIENPMFTCFGVRTRVVYRDVIDFFESRCVPRNRTGIDRILRAFGLTEYDPYVLCRLKKGTHAGDGHWIEFMD